MPWQFPQNLYCMQAYLLLILPLMLRELPQLMTTLDQNCWGKVNANMFQLIDKPSSQMQLGESITSFAINCSRKYCIFRQKFFPTHYNNIGMTFKQNSGELIPSHVCAEYTLLQWSCHKATWLPCSQTSSCSWSFVTLL